MSFQQKKGYAFFLVGCTATGKTLVAHHIAEKTGMTVLSADSMLVYKGMNVGTAKPEKTMQQEVRYLGIDLANPDEPFNLAKYLEYAKHNIKKVDGSLIVTGGSGLYIKGLLHGLDNNGDVASNEETRVYATKLLNEGGVVALQEALLKESKELFDMVKDKSNPRRLIRALEMALSSNKKVKRTWSTKESPKITGILMDREELKSRIVARTKYMFKNGLIEEAKMLLSIFDKNSSFPNFTALQAIGYKEAIDFIKGKISIEEAVSKTITRTFQLAKKQMTWFRHQLNVDWIQISAKDTVEDIAEKVIANWDRTGPVKLAF